MSRLFVDRATLDAFIARLDNRFNRIWRLYLIGETSQVYEGWQPWTERIQFTAEVVPGDRDAFGAAVNDVKTEMGIDVLEESPADVIPLPDGHVARARPIEHDVPHLQAYHFDPYSVAFWSIAMGNEQDYQLVLNYLEHGWISMDDMDELLTDLLPRFTFQTIQQDPAEFRRRYKGLRQMWHARQRRALQNLARIGSTW